MPTPPSSGIGAEAFATALRDHSNHVVADFETPSDVLLILFGGIAGGVSMPPFEFFRLAAAFPVRKLFLRDPYRAWYQRGLPGVGDDADAVRRELAGRIASSSASRVVMVGASAGGFAALQFGSALGIDQVHAFSPQTFVDAANRSRAGDDRWAPQIDLLHRALGPQANGFDLRPLLVDADNGGTPLHVHVGDDDAVDLAHAVHVRDAPGVAIHTYPQGGHTLVKRLRDRGELSRILLDALDRHA